MDAGLFAAFFFLGYALVLTVWVLTHRDDFEEPEGDNEL